MQKEIDYVVWREGKHFVSQCLNVDVSSFGESIDDAVANLREAVELYCDNEQADFTEIDAPIIGKEKVNV